MTLHKLFADWQVEDRRHLQHILAGELDGDDWSDLHFEDALLRAAGPRTRYVIPDGEPTVEGVSPEDASAKELEPYRHLLQMACGKFKVKVEEASVYEAECYLVQKLFVAGLDALGPKERAEVFARGLNVYGAAEKAPADDPDVTGEIATAAAMGAARLSGFGVYQLASTVVGAVTEGIGITLPFVFYTGMSSAIRTAIGPLGWTLLVASLAKKLTDPKWKRLVAALVYIITVRHRPLHESGTGI